MTTAEARWLLADTLTQALPGWSVYAEPPATLTAPAVVLTAGDPYRESAAYRIVDVRLRLVVLLSEGSDRPLDMLDAAIDDVTIAALSLPFVAVDRVGQVGQVQEVGGVGYLAATIDATLGIERT